MPKYKSTSHRVRSTHVSYLPDGTIRTQQTQRGPRQIAHAQAELKLRRGAVLQQSSAVEREILNEFGPPPAASGSVLNGTGSQWEPCNEEMMDSSEWQTDDEGTQQVYTELAEGITQEYHHHIAPRKLDPRTRRDRDERRNEAWSIMYPALIDAHLQYDMHGAPSIDAEQRHASIIVVDLFERRAVSFPLVEDESLNITMARHGYIGTAPLHPTSAISTQALELLRILTSRCPQHSLHAFVRGLCDLHCIAYRPGLRNRLSIAFDVYLHIRQCIQDRINLELGRATPKWRLQNACAPCTYTLEREPVLKYKMLFAMDGNESLKRIERARREKDLAGKSVHSENIEREDSRTVINDMYLSKDAVNCFKNEVKRRPDPPPEYLQDEMMPKVHHEFAADVIEGRPTDGADNPTPCVQRWTNLADENTKKRLGFFRETGLFLVVCRHGTAFLLCDMVQSGELAKYPLALSNELIDAFGEDIMIGYDIGCGFSATANNSPKLGPKVRQYRTRYCVGSFHGHAHCRLCQLDWHPLYIKGCGLEDFETCERVFSRSNALASCTWHASMFHRRQSILRWFESWNLDRYAECSQFLLNNYIQALSNLESLPEQLTETMCILTIPSAKSFESWRLEEKLYLQNLKREPEDDILKMEYVETLMKLQAASDKWEHTSRQWLESDFSQLQDYSNSQSQTRKLERARARGLDTILVLQKAVLDLESKLEIYERWVPGSLEWNSTLEMIETRKYRRALDHLEGLVVARLFELTKAHQSGTGVKLRKQIAKALSARSLAIRTAVKNYNTAAAALKPPRPPLDIQVVLNHVYIGQFDLLRQSRNQVLDVPWAQPAEREAATSFYKIAQSQEELVRVNVEARRLRTFIEDEEQDLATHISRLEHEQPTLAYQIAKIRKLRVAVNNIHWRCLDTLEGLPGFTGIKGPGIQLGRVEQSQVVVDRNSENCDEDEQENDEVQQLDDDDEIIDALDFTFGALTIV